MADAPFELTEEIAKLEQKHAETPGGRYFVPLANAYRKIGDFARAEALLHEGLRRHPDYLSAHIVLGRCYTDRGAHDSATAEFRHVLSLDAQNLIALRTLGELAAARGRNDDAAHWYRELLAVDPMNDEARTALDGLARRETPESEPEAPAALEVEPVADERAEVEEPPLLVEVAEGEELEPVAGFEPTASALDEPLGAELDAAFGEWEPSDDVDAFYLEAIDLSIDSPAEEETGGAPADGMPAGDVADESLFPGEAVLELPAAEEESVAEQPLQELAPPVVEEAQAVEDAEEEEVAAADEALAAEAVDAPGYGFEDGVDDVGDIGDVGDVDDAGEVITRTIADLYARQGLYDRAASVYRELIRREDGSDVELEARLADVERRAREEAEGYAAAEPLWVESPAAEFAPVAPEAEDAFAASFAYGFAGVPEPQGPAPEGPPEPAEPSAPGGPAAVPIAAYLAELLAWAPAEPEPAAPAPDEALMPWELPVAPDGEPTAAEGAEEAPADEPEPLPWELPMPEPVLPASGGDDFSFDTFFAEEAPTEAPRAAEPQTEEESEEEDLESFQAWLRGLKR